MTAIGKNPDIGRILTHSSRWIVFICQSSTRENEQSFPPFSNTQNFCFYCLSSQQLIVPKLPKTVVVSCLFRFRYSQTQFEKLLYQSQVMKFAKGSLAVQAKTGKKFPSSFNSWGWTIDKYNRARLSSASFNLSKRLRARARFLPHMLLGTWEQKRN